MSGNSFASAATGRGQPTVLLLLLLCCQLQPSCLLATNITTLHCSCSDMWQNVINCVPLPTCFSQHAADHLTEDHLGLGLSIIQVCLWLLCVAGLQACWQRCPGGANSRSKKDLAHKVVLFLGAALQDMRGSRRRDQSGVHEQQTDDSFMTHYFFTPIHAYADGAGSINQGQPTRLQILRGRPSMTLLRLP
jgi:hypothetical protein